MRYFAMLAVLVAVGCSMGQRPVTRNAAQPESTALNKPIPIPPDMERRDIQDPNRYLYPEGR
jgi:hypothetical protein